MNHPVNLTITHKPVKIHSLINRYKVQSQAVQPPKSLSPLIIRQLQKKENLQILQDLHHTKKRLLRLKLGQIRGQEEESNLVLPSNPPMLW